MSNYNRRAAVNYGLKYALNHNPDYPYYSGKDCTNFVSQCLRSGGAKNDFNSAYPWWCVDMDTSLCWSVAHSLYWYIISRTNNKAFGIKADTRSIYGDKNFNPKTFNYLQIGDIIQYSWKGDRINHSAIITDFKYANGGKTPLISQHQPDKVNRVFYRNAHRTMFHHITSIN